MAQLYSVQCVPLCPLAKITRLSVSVSVTLKVKRPNTCTNLKKTANPQFVSKWWESERSAGVLCHAVSLCEGSLTCWMTSSTLYNLQQSPSKVLLFCWFSGFFVPVLIFYYIHYILYSMFQVYFLILWLSLLTCYMYVALMMRYLLASYLGDINRVWWWESLWQCRTETFQGN